MTIPSEAKYVTVPSPIGGLNAVDSLASMPPEDAISLVNLVPQTWGVAVRHGFRYWATGLADRILALLPWYGATSKLYAIDSAGEMLDITVPGAVGTPVETGLSSTEDWFHVHYANGNGTGTIAVNGVDDPILIDGGATIRRIIAGNGTDPDTIDGVDPALFVHVTTHQRRLWFVEKDSTLAWYLPADADGKGTAQAFDFGPLFKRGGFLRALFTWTVDTGEGQNDHLCAFSDNGEVAIYAGVDVETADSWQLKGLYYIGAPCPGRRFVTRMGGDLMCLTETGIVSLNTVLTSTQVNATTEDTYSRKIQFLISDLVSNPPNVIDWQVLYTPTNNFLMINVPSVIDGGAGQIVANQVNRSWCLFSGMDAAVWIEHERRPFFGYHAGRVFRAWDGFQDFQPNSASEDLDDYVAEPVKWRGQQAYNYFGAPALQKQLGIYRANFLSGSAVTYFSCIHYDFTLVPLAPPSTPSGPGVGVWGAGIWDTDLWGGNPTLRRLWESSEGIGIAASLAIAGSSENETIWVSTDVSYKVGGIL